MPQDFDFAQHAHEMSGAPATQQGMPAYPLYGLPTLGQETEVAVPFYKKPLFCYAVGTAAGLGVGFFVWGFLKPRMKPNPKKRRTTRKKAEPAPDPEE